MQPHRRHLQSEVDGERDLANRTTRKSQRPAPAIWQYHDEIKVTDWIYEVLLNGRPATTFTADPAGPVDHTYTSYSHEGPPVVPFMVPIVVVATTAIALREPGVMDDRGVEEGRPAFWTRSPSEDDLASASPFGTK
jgi:hypothetical protein